MNWMMRTLGFASALLPPFAFAIPSEPPPRIVIFWAAFGNGHKSAAESIRNSIVKQNPHAQVILKDATEFMDPVTRKFSLEGFKFFTLQSADSYDLWFKNYIEKIKTTASVGQMPLVRQYDPAALSSWIKEQNPSVIVSTFNHATEALVNLRNEGVLPPDLKIAWQHTDYVDAPYFAQISKEIDMTFLGHPALEEAWVKKHGVSPSKVAAPGLAVSEEVRAPWSATQRTEFLKSRGLNPEVSTITLMSGINGVGDFPKIVRSLARHITTPIQIVAICARNESHVKRLNELKAKLPSNVTLKVEGFIKESNVIPGYVKSSDLYITKAGGLSSTEAFHMGVPTLFLDNNGGQERFNIDFFSHLKVGMGTRNELTIGRLVKTIIDDPKLRAQWVANQKIFREKLGNNDSIATWVLKASNQYLKDHPQGTAYKVLPRPPLRNVRNCMSEALSQILSH